MAKRWGFRPVPTAELTVNAASSVTTRRMLPTTDIHRIGSIERAAHDSPWLVQHWRRIFADPAHGGTVAMINDRVVGFATYQIDGTDIMLSNLAVDPLLQRQGVGRALIASLISNPPASFDGSRFFERAGKLIIYCHEEMLVFQQFLKACGIPAIRVYRGYYRVDGRDCYVFQTKRG